MPSVFVAFESFLHQSHLNFSLFSENLRMMELCAACEEDHPMGPACVKKAREKRMKEKKVSNVSFCLDSFAAITISTTFLLAV